MDLVRVNARGLDCKSLRGEGGEDRQIWGAVRVDLARDPQTDLDTETQVDPVGVNPRGLDC